ncbi:MAG: hypothetical protein ACFE92_17000, partial [Promethearchaeota archaeon]
ESKNAKVENLEILLNFLENLKNEFSIEYQIFNDASLIHRINDKGRLENLYETGKIIQCPSRLKADDLIIEYASRHPEQTIIISNDCFKEYEIRSLLLLKFAIIFEEFITIPKIRDYLELTVKKTVGKNAGRI